MASLLWDLGFVRICCDHLNPSGFCCSWFTIWFHCNYDSGYSFLLLWSRVNSRIFLKSVLSSYNAGPYRLDSMAAADIAGEMLVIDYANHRFKGKPPPRMAPQSLSCFDQTIPVSAIRQPGKHELCRLLNSELPYWSPSCEFRYKVGRKYPKNYTKKGDGEKIVKGICPPCSKLRKASAPEAGGFRERDNPPNTLVRFYSKTCSDATFECLVSNS